LEALYLPLWLGCGYVVALGQTLRGQSFAIVFFLQ